MWCQHNVLSKQLVTSRTSCVTASLKQWSQLFSLQSGILTSIVRIYSSQTTLSVSTSSASSLQLSLLHTCPFIAAGWTLVLLYVLSSCWSNLHTFSMIPLFTNVTTNPEFISCVTAPTTATEGISMFFLFILEGIILFLWGKRHRLWWFDLVLLRCTLLQASPKLHNSQYTHAHTKIYMYVFINDKS